MKSRQDNFGWYLVAAQVTANVLNLIWTVWLTIEQIEYGWGHPTNMDLGVLWVWLTELICAPVLVATIVFFVVCAFHDVSKKVRNINISLFVLLVAQYVVTNLFTLT